jgi:PAS domain S-box-containing protein
MTLATFDQGFVLQPSTPPAAEADPFLRRIVDAIVEPVFVKDSARRFVLLNDACCALLGVERAELLGRRGHRQVAADRHLDEDILRTGEDQVGAQDIRDALGRPRRVPLRKLLYRDAQGTPFIIGLLQDEPVGDSTLTRSPGGTADERLGLRRELQQTLRRGGLVLHYQPIVSLSSGRIRGAEALVRWPSPTRGLMLPDGFIPLAEETGLALPLGEWVLRNACHQAARWLHEGWIDDGFTLNVNLSPRQLRDPALVRYTSEILRESGLPARMLQLELSELTVAKETVKACELRDLGLRLAIDDFGTGYASLASLRELPVNTVKIAGTFIAGLGDDEIDLYLVRTILTLARDLGLDCVSEGIETSLQLALLQDLRCELGQGFLFHRALPAREFESLLTAEKPGEEPALSLQKTA